MKYIFLFTLLFLGFSGNAQMINGVKIEDLDVKYIIFEPQSTFGKKQINILIDYGQIEEKRWLSKKELNQIAQLQDADQKAIDFNSALDALNYISKYQFKLIDSYQEMRTDVDNNVFTTTRKYVLEKQ